MTVAVTLPRLSWGDPAAERRVLLVHGLGSSGALMWRLGDAIAATGAVAVAVDLRGHGDAPRSLDYSVDAYAADLAATLPDGGQLELFSFPAPPPRPSYPEACGARHIAFAVDDVAACKAALERHGVPVQEVRVDEYTGRRFVFFSDPDGLPLELYED